MFLVPFEQSVICFFAGGKSMTLTVYGIVKNDNVKLINGYSCQLRFLPSAVGVHIIQPFSLPNEVLKHG